MDGFPYYAMVDSKSLKAARNQDFWVTTTNWHAALANQPLQKMCAVEVDHPNSFWFWFFSFCNLASCGVQREASNGLKMLNNWRLIIRSSVKSFLQINCIHFHVEIEDNLIMGGMLLSNTSLATLWSHVERTKAQSFFLSNGRISQKFSSKFFGGQQYGSQCVDGTLMITPGKYTNTAT